MLICLHIVSGCFNATTTVLSSCKKELVYTVFYFKILKCLVSGHFQKSLLTPWSVLTFPKIAFSDITSVVMNTQAWKLQIKQD